MATGSAPEPGPTPADAVARGHRPSGILGHVADPSDRPADNPGAGDPQQAIRAARVEAAAAALSAAQQSRDSSLLALRHAELGVALIGIRNVGPAVEQLRTALGFVQLLRADGQHEAERLLRLTSLSTPPPTQTDFDLDRFEGEVRVLLVETLIAAGDTLSAAAELRQARAFTKGFFRRRLRTRLDRAESLLSAKGVVQHSAVELTHRVQRASSPGEQRALRLRLSNQLLDERRFDDAVRESLLLVRDADAAADAPTRAAARQVLGLALEGSGRPDDGRAALAEAYRDLQSHGDFAGAAGMAEALAARLQDAGEASAALTVLRTGMAAAERAGDDQTGVRIGIGLGAALDRTGDRRAAVEAMESAATWAERSGQAVAAADARHGAAVVLGAMDTDDALVDALALLENCRRAYLDYGHPDRAAGCDHEAGALLGRRGSYAAAVSRYRAALDAYLDLPPDERDAGSWPDEVGDCRANLAYLETIGAGRPEAPGVVPLGLFASGGHTMQHRPAAGGPTT